ncbi:MAG TPA: hypothetical protein VNG90_01655 [Candidatus Acidoferrum sp.]|nr:hypothetical protein [Candidatus Acidoferrum sp.]
MERFHYFVLARLPEEWRLVLDNQEHILTLLIAQGLKEQKKLNPKEYLIFRCLLENRMRCSNTALFAALKGVDLETSERLLDEAKSKGTLYETLSGLRTVIAQCRFLLKPFGIWIELKKREGYFLRYVP